MKFEALRTVKILHCMSGLKYRGRFDGFCNSFRNCLRIRPIIQRGLWIRISVLFRLMTKHWMLP